MTPAGLLIRTWGNIGDAILLTPCLPALKAAAPDRPIALLCKSDDHRNVFLHNPYIDLLALKESDWSRDSGPVFEPAVHWPNTLFEIGVSNAIAERLGLTIEDDQPQLFLTADETQSARRTLAPYARPIVAIHKSSTFSYKQWFDQRWLQLISLNPACTFIELGRGDDTALPGVINLRNRPLRESFALLGECDALLAVDSSMAHAAAALHVPSVVLFGASNPLVFGHSGNINLYGKVECSPCLDLLHYASCPFKQRCMRAISVEAVHNSLSEILKCGTVSLPEVRPDDSPEESELLKRELLLADNIALTFDWDKNPLLYAFETPEAHVPVSENVLRLLSCFSVSQPVPLADAIRRFSHGEASLSASRLTSALLSTIAELMDAEVLVPPQGRAPLYPDSMVEAYVHAREIPHEISDVIARVADVKKTTRVLDACTGTGSIARAIADYSDHVVGIDVNHSFLKAAAKLAADKGVSVQFRQACANKLALQDGRFDVIVISQALHWLDIYSATRGIDHALPPDGLLYVLESKPFLADDHPLRSIFRYGLGSKEAVEKECNRHARWCASLFEALAQREHRIQFTRCWVFHQRRPFDLQYASAFFLPSAPATTGDQEQLWKRLEREYRNGSSPDRYLGDMYWLLLEYRKMSVAVSPFESFQNIDISLIGTIEIPQ
jgi:ADP-heptose:LPS heptosyltransferase/SAM-dependent methyltransferase